MACNREQNITTVLFPSHTANNTFLNGTKVKRAHKVLFFLLRLRRRLLPVCVGFEKKDLAARRRFALASLCENCEHLIGEIKERGKKRSNFRTNFGSFLSLFTLANTRPRETRGHCETVERARVLVGDVFRASFCLERSTGQRQSAKLLGIEFSHRWNLNTRARKSSRTNTRLVVSSPRSKRKREKE